MNSGIFDLNYVTQKKQFAEELASKDQIICELSSKIDSIAISPPNADSPREVLPLAETESVDTDLTPKIEQDLLLIGDSLLRDLDANILNPGGDTTITCLPGARPRDVVKKFKQMTMTHRYKRVVVHVGSNLIPKFARDSCSSRITECMESIRELAPDSQIAYSSVLPKNGDHLLQGINQVNFNVIRSGKIGPNRTRFGHVSHVADFTTAKGDVDCDYNYTKWISKANSY